MSEIKRYTAWAAEVALPRGTMVVLAADYDTLAKRVAELEGLLREFCGRVDRGEARSVKTYAKFKATLAGQPQQGEPEWPKEQCPVTGAIRDVDPADLPAIHSENGQDEHAALSTALFNALESYEATRSAFSRKDQKIHAIQCELIRRHAAHLLAEQPAAHSEDGREVHRYRVLRALIEAGEWLAGAVTITDKFGNSSNDWAADASDLDAMLDKLLYWAPKTQPARQVGGDEREAFDYHRFVYECGGTESRSYILEAEELDELVRRSALAQAAVVMPERMTTIPEGKTISYAAGYEDALDAVGRLNRNTVSLELLQRIAKVPRGSQGLIDNADALDELRTILGANCGSIDDLTHDSDCSTNNHGCPDLLGPCDCSLSEGARK